MPHFEQPLLSILHWKIESHTTWVRMDSDGVPDPIIIDRQHRNERKGRGNIIMILKTGTRRMNAINKIAWTILIGQDKLLPPMLAVSHYDDSGQLSLEVLQVVPDWPCYAPLRWSSWRKYRTGGDACRRKRSEFLCNGVRVQRVQNLIQSKSEFCYVI